LLWSRVARWYIFKPKIQIWVTFGVYCNERRGQFLRPFGLFYSHLVYYVVILVYFSPFWYVVPRKIWQPCCDPGKILSKNLKFGTKFR
jgi:hypothetical protein